MATLRNMTPLGYDIRPIVRNDGVAGFQWVTEYGSSSRVFDTYLAAVRAAQHDSANSAKRQQVAA